MAESSPLAEKIGICVAGIGRAGMIHARNFATNVPGARLVALADPAKEALEAAGKELGVSALYTDVAAALKDQAVDAIVVAAPTVFHKDIVIAAAAAGKHVLCEKPMATDAAACERMIAAADKAGVKLQLGFVRRYDRSFLAAREAIDRGEIGQVVCVKSLTHGPSIPKGWQYDLRKSLGPLAEVNSHDIDTLRWITGSEFKEVYAIAGNYRCPDAKAEFPDFYDNVVLVASFTNGMQGFIGGAVSVRYGYDARVEVLGQRGVVFIGELSGARGPQTHYSELAGPGFAVCNDTAGMTRPIAKSWRDLFAEAYVREDASFIECILLDKTPIATGIDGLIAVKVVEAGNRSIIERRPVRLS
jgi:myo-inositol 2-dehydrogenase/D-chiro-inositol 1-dehydrogenase/scyllo-inositol 2-dehydrogenase (NAD+)